MLLAEFPPWFTLAVGTFLGLVFGSFLNVVIHRLPREESVAFPASHCPACGTAIRGYDNIPVLSWVILRGKARCCGARISPRYPLVELGGGLLGAAIVELHLLPNAHLLGAGHALGLFASYLALGLGLIALTAIDLEYMILPDSLTLGGAALGIATVSLRDSVSFMDAVGGAAFGFVLVWFPLIFLYEKIRGMPGMGLGDAKLVMLAGAWFGVFGAVFTLLAGAMQGTLGAIVILLSQGKIEEPEAVREEREAMHRALEEVEGEEREALEREFTADPIFHEPDEGFGRARIPFGPFLALACLELLLFYEPLRNLIEEVFWI